MTTRPSPPSPAVDAERRTALVGAKLAALVAGRWGPGQREHGSVGTSATLLDPPGDQAAADPGDRSAGPSDGASAAAARRRGGRRGWVLADADAAPDRALGPALVWADRHGVTDLHLLADAPTDAAVPDAELADAAQADATVPDAELADAQADAAVPDAQVDPPADAELADAQADAADVAGAAGAVGTLARQAGYLADPPTVWSVAGTSLDVAGPAPLPARPAAPAPSDLVDLLIDAGLEIVVEGGMVRGEINGLEVARIVDGHTTAGEPIDAPQLEVGVGKADRELTAMVHGGLPTVEQLGRVVTIVREHRRPGAPRHPLNQLVPDRWLRAVLCRTPALVGAAALRPAEGPRPRPNLSERDVAVAAGEAADGSPLVVACAVGIALDLVPLAADARAAVDAGTAPGRSPSRLVLAVPERDDHPTIRRLAARLRAPAEVVPVPGDWRAAG